MPEDEREKLRLECYSDLGHLQTQTELPERVFRLLEKIIQRLDRIETGTFHVTEAPTEPERRKSSGAMPAFRAQNVIDELERGKKP
jgi:hypothetical protein